MASIEVEDLTKQYGGTRGVEGLTFSVGNGEVFGLLGPDGAGKTTTIRILMGLLSPSGGDASILGHDLESRRERTAMKQTVGYLPANPSFDDTRTGNEVLTHHGALKSDERSEDLCAQFGLESQLEQPIKEYSPDQKRLLATVVAFMHDPELAVLDEPTAGVERSTADRLCAFFQTEETTLFVGSHSLATAATLCDRVAILRNGHLIDRLTTERLPDHGGKIVRFVTPDPVADDTGIENGYGVEIEHTAHTGNTTTSVQFLYTGTHEALLERLDEYTIRDLTIEAAPIETVLTHWYGARLGANSGGVNV